MLSAIRKVGATPARACPHLTATPQTRTSGSPAYGSSVFGFAKRYHFASQESAPDLSWQDKSLPCQVSHTTVDLFVEWGVNFIIVTTKVKDRQLYTRSCKTHQDRRYIRTVNLRGSR